MHFLSIILLNLLAVMSTAAPLETSPLKEVGSISARQDNPFFFGAYMCSDPDWKGTCIEVQRLKGYCIIYGKTSDISSFGPDKGFTCSAYGTFDCTGDSLKLEYPGVSDLASLGWDNRIISFRCDGGDSRVDRSDRAGVVD
ncbi:hypothetical protein HDK77DRAFT_478927 [Phyllosticta capitalensis]